MLSGQCLSSGEKIRKVFRFSTYAAMKAVTAQQNLPEAAGEVFSAALAEGMSDMDSGRAAGIAAAGRDSGREGESGLRLRGAGL